MYMFEVLFISLAATMEYLFEKGTFHCLAQRSDIGIIQPALTGFQPGVVSSIL